MRCSPTARFTAPPAAPFFGGTSSTSPISFSSSSSSSSSSSFSFSSSFSSFDNSPSHHPRAPLTNGIYTWDAENRLVAVESSAGVPAAARMKETWSYLPDGRWSQCLVSSWNGSAYILQSTRKFLWDGQVLLAILDAQSSILASFLRGTDLSGTLQGAGGVGGLLAVTLGGNGTHFAASDGNGNVAALFSANDGSLTANYDYDPFGNLLRRTGPASLLNPLRFSTQFADDVTGDLKYLYRIYSPSTGGWKSKDPIEERGFKLLQTIKSKKLGDYNDYLFVQNNPLRFYDSLGLSIADVANMYFAFVNELTKMCACHLSCPEKGWLQNIPPYVYWGCTRQTENLEGVFDRLHYEDMWDITVNFDDSRWPLNHNSVRVKPRNPDDPVVDADTWKGCFSVTWPTGSSQKNFKRCFTCKELLKK